MRFKRIVCLCLVMMMFLSLAGCRTRVMPEGYEGVTREEPEMQRPPEPPAEPPEKQEPEPEPQEEEKEKEEPSEPQPDAQTVENPESQRKEYSPDADALISKGAENKIAEVRQDELSEETACPLPQEGGEGNIITEQEEELEAKEVVPDDNAHELAAEDQGEKAETLSQYYGALLSSRLGSLFECQRHYIYWETPQPYVTVHKTSAEHTLMLSAGAYDVSAKLLEDNLMVDNGWVIRKNPGAIVKCVSSDVLGEGVSSDAAAASVRDALMNREGWENTEAVKSGRVIILSESLMDTPAGCTAASLYIACALYPDLFEDTDPGEALELLAKEEGSGYSGMYALWN